MQAIKKKPKTVSKSRREGGERREARGYPRGGEGATSLGEEDYVTGIG